LRTVRVSPSRVRTIGIVHPLFYGMLLFARATGNGAQLLPTASGPRNGVKVWATRNVGGTVRVVLINPAWRVASGGARRISVTLSGMGAQGTVERLRAPGLDARDGITLAGKSFGSETLDGRLH